MTTSTTPFMHLLLTILALSFSSGCPGHRPQPRPAGEPDCFSPKQSKIGDPWGQGRELLGLGFLDGNKTFVQVDRFQVNSLRSRAGNPIDLSGIRAHQLTGSELRGGTELRLDATSWEGASAVGQARCTDPRFEGQTRNFTVSIRKVRAASLHDPPGKTDPVSLGLWTAYSVELERGGTRFNACRDGEEAFPVLGYWDERGTYVRDGNVFSFACTRKDVALCIRAGYSDEAEQHPAGELFEACTRMARADYCGDGQSYTRDGSFVTIWDTQGVVEAEHREPLTFEAAWARDGVVCMARPRWSFELLGATPRCAAEGRMTRRCTSAEEASRLFPGRPLVFNESCETHPCEVRRTEPPSPAEATASGATSWIESRIEERSHPARARR